MIKREIYTNFNKEKKHFKTAMHFFNEKNVQRLIKPEKKITTLNIITSIHHFLSTIFPVKIHQSKTYFKA